MRTSREGPVANLIRDHVFKLSLPEKKKNLIKICIHSIRHLIPINEQVRHRFSGYNWTKNLREQGYFSLQRTFTWLLQKAGVQQIRTLYFAKFKRSVPAMLTIGEFLHINNDLRYHPSMKRIYEHFQEICGKFFIKI